MGVEDYPRVEADLSDASILVLHAVRLYKAGKAPMVIAGGGAIKWLGSKTPEAYECG